MESGCCMEVSITDDDGTSSVDEAGAPRVSSPVDLTVDYHTDVSEQGLLGPVNGVSVYHADVQALSPGMYITDAIVNACLMKSHSRRQVTAYYSHWSIPGLSNSSPVLPLYSGLHLFPTCFSNHWWLIVFDNRRLKAPLIHTIDSLFTGRYPLERHTHANEKLALHLRCKLAKNIICRVTQQPQGSNDCAVHVIHNAWTLMKLGPNGMQNLNKRNISTSRTGVLNYINSNATKY